MNKSEIYLGGGCFWGTEHFLKQIEGVILTETGYANGNTASPTYEDVCSKNSGHTEAVKVVYDPGTVTLKMILELFYKTIDPTSLNKQGNDIGSQYRSGIYYISQTDLPIIENSLKELAKNYDKPLQIEIEPLTHFFIAENYHQDYLEKNLGGYCHISPELFKLAKEANKPNIGSDAVNKYFLPDTTILKAKLNDIQYAVTQHDATEPPFKNEYWNTFQEGIYVDITTGEPLFFSTDKFNSECGWPAFSKPINKDIVVEKKDISHGMIRTEVRSKTGNAHLGHIFPDGPAESGGLRYCINSASLRFVPKDKMEQEGYKEYLHLLNKSQ